MKAMTYSSRGETFRFTGANADLWNIATEHGRIFSGEDFHTLALAFSENDHNQHLAASKSLITKLWSSHAYLGPYPFLDCLSKFEFARQFHDRYREHVCHQLKVYLLGLGVLSCSNRLRDAVCEMVGEDHLDIVWLVTAVFHDIGYVIENEHSHPGSQAWKQVMAEYRATMRNPLAPIVSQCKLPRPTEREIQKAFSISPRTLDGMGDLEKAALFGEFAEEAVKAGLGQLVDGDSKTPLQRYFDYAQKTPSTRPPFKDHGVASALLLAKSWADLDDYLQQLAKQLTLSRTDQPALAVAQALDRMRSPLDELMQRRAVLKAHIMRAAGAISLHNITPGQWDHDDAITHGLSFDTFRIAIGRDASDRNALAFLLAFVDTLQDWDRPTFSEQLNEHALHSRDLSVRPDRQARKVLVYVEKDAAEFKDPPNSKHTRYSRVVRCLKEFLDEDDVDSLIAWSNPNEPATITWPAPVTPEVSSTANGWEIDFNAVIKRPTSGPWRWSVVLSKDEASRHGDLMASLKRNDDDTRVRYIDSGFAYWGIGPTIQWRTACHDSFYTVMRKGIDTFHSRWKVVLRSFGDARPDLQPHLPCVYVSYGVGTGEKDRVVLGTLDAMRLAPAYVPIDMSLDMLVNGAQVASRDLIDPGRILPLQIDFASSSELVTLSEFRDNVLQGKPVLFSLLGNTLANFEEDHATLRTLAALMRKSDYLLLELAATRTVDVAAAKQAADEYSRISSFERFVRSALTQHTDLPLNKVFYHAEPCHGDEAIQIDMDYVSVKKSRGRLIDGSEIKLQPGEKIRLYRSRKYTHTAIQRILRSVGLTEIACDLQVYDPESPFGFYLGMCSR